MPLILGEDALERGLKVAIDSVAFAVKDFRDTRYDRLVYVAVALNFVTKGRGKIGQGYPFIRGRKIKDGIQKDGSNRQSNDQENKSLPSSFSSHQACILSIT